MKRRQFLKAGFAAASMPMLARSARLFASPADGPRFLLVFLRGGYDCNNLLVPWSSSFYQEARPSLAIAPPGNAADSALRLDDAWALAPSVRPALEGLYRARQLAFVPFAGTDDLSRSHFETQDDIESGQEASARHGFDTGFMARLAIELGARARPISFTSALPLAFSGGGDVPNIALTGRGRAVFDPRQSRLLAHMYQGTELEQSVREGLALRQQVAGQYAGEMQAAGRGAPDPRSFAAQTTRIAALMREDYRLGFVDVGGWDTHTNEGGADGTLARRLDDLATGLAAYANAMGEAWRDTTVAVISEFGRTFRENGNGGTDHGHGTVYWFLGGNVRGGRIAGEQLAVTRSNLLQDRDYKVLNNYRGLFAGLFGKLWNLSPTALEHIFPATKPRDLGLV